ncbi:hypothetical protein CICLE_v10013117mg [Citrus x clementina]|uniref:WAT1-related protein n=1 Tax=Citrus clementina TaxID=85681 RepID=V4S6E7_CITCL|nr:hypothetical protein CICLE_v10013117mg [Citrus x clementina]
MFLWFMLMLLALLATAVLAILFERKNKSKITKCVLCDIFFLGLLGAVLGRMIFFAGLEYASLTFASATAIGQCCFHPLPFLAAVLRYQHASNRGKKRDPFLVIRIIHFGIHILSLISFANAY